MNSETTEAIEKANKPLVQALVDVKAELRMLSRMSMLHALYERAEVVRMAAEFATLLDEDHQAWTALTQSQQELKAAAFDEIGYEARVKQFGADKAREQNAPMEAALKWRITTSAALNAFEAKHPLIAELVLGSRKRKD